jgi:hypothetical protein
VHPGDVAAYVAESVAELRSRLARYLELGVAGVLLSEDTSLDVTFTKRERALVQTTLPSTLLDSAGGNVGVVYVVPDLGSPGVSRTLILHMDLSNYDGDPPTAELWLPERVPLPPDEWPVLGNGGIVREHPEFHRPFFCRRGLREYHSHPQHEDDPWDLYREALPLHALVVELLDDLQHRWIGRQ